MPRYVSRPKSSWVADDVWEEPFIPSLTVEDSEPVDTGLFDKDGNTIWRVNDPIGFIHH